MVFTPDKSFTGEYFKRTKLKFIQHIYVLITIFFERVFTSSLSREADTPTLVISMVLGVVGFLILLLLLSMVFITLAEGREQRLISQEEEEEEVEEEEEEGCVGNVVMCGGGGRLWLWLALKRAWTSLALPFIGLAVNLQERHYIQVI